MQEPYWSVVRASVKFAVSVLQLALAVFTIGKATSVADVTDPVDRAKLTRLRIAIVLMLAGNLLGIWL